MTYFMKAFSDKAGLLKRLPRPTPSFIELRGRESLLCDGAGRIACYSETRIELCIDRDRLYIVGQGLTLRHLSFGKLAIDGRIDEIGFLPTDTDDIR